jgi:DNA mismatch repair ATPase MutS
MIIRESEQRTIRLNDELENVKNRIKEFTYLIFVKIRDAFRRTCDELQQTQKIVTDYKQVKYSSCVELFSKDFV